MYKKLGIFAAILFGLVALFLIPAQFKASPAHSYVGVWQTYASDTGEIVFYTLSTAKNEVRRTGQQHSGQWKMVGTKATIVWPNGWREQIFPTKQGVVRESWAPGHPMEKAPMRRSPMIKVHPITPKVAGLWELRTVANGVQKMVIHPNHALFPAHDNRSIGHWKAHRRGVMLYLHSGNIFYIYPSDGKWRIRNLLLKQRSRQGFAVKLAERSFG